MFQPSNVTTWTRTIFLFIPNVLSSSKLPSQEHQQPTALVLVSFLEKWKSKREKPENQKHCLTMEGSDRIFSFHWNWNFSLQNKWSAVLLWSLQDKHLNQVDHLLEAPDKTRVEKISGRTRKVSLIVGLVVCAAVLALVTGLLVWHFHRKLLQWLFCQTCTAAAAVIKNTFPQWEDELQSVMFLFWASSTFHFSESFTDTRLSGSTHTDMPVSLHCFHFCLCFTRHPWHGSKKHYLCQLRKIPEFREMSEYSQWNSWVTFRCLWCYQG